MRPAEDAGGGTRVANCVAAGTSFPPAAVFHWPPAIRAGRGGAGLSKAGGSGARLQLAELKQECLARGLETKGIKQDLINRLQAYLEEHAEEEANEEDVLGDETEEEEPKPIELPVKEEEPPEKTVDV
ncbi:hypothetical protein QTO34_017454 [Cnephaeus nilssonii]|uniref:SAP domain-containing ribonucleoprotein n=1 Tax=Cnephaeus nilssonii TaxID=3371016 RepID=A0AA40LR89_CNENI|nr:hypothetical protein QTO34_017454 [Eptesicus nilssonii]